MNVYVDQVLSNLYKNYQNGRVEYEISDTYSLITPRQVTKHAIISVTENPDINSVLGQLGHAWVHLTPGRDSLERFNQSRELEDFIAECESILELCRSKSEVSCVVGDGSSFWFTIWLAWRLRTNALVIGEVPPASGAWFNRVKILNHNGLLDETQIILADAGYCYLVQSSDVANLKQLAESEFFPRNGRAFSRYTALEISRAVECALNGGANLPVLKGSQTTHSLIFPKGLRKIGKLKSFSSCTGVAPAIVGGLMDLSFVNAHPELPADGWASRAQQLQIVGGRADGAKLKLGTLKRDELNKLVQPGWQVDQRFSALALPGCIPIPVAELFYETTDGELGVYRGMETLNPESVEMTLKNLDGTQVKLPSGSCDPQLDKDSRKQFSVNVNERGSVEISALTPTAHGSPGALLVAPNSRIFDLPAAMRNTETNFIESTGLLTYNEGQFELDAHAIEKLRDSKFDPGFYFELPPGTQDVTANQARNVDWDDSEVQNSLLASLNQAEATLDEMGWRRIPVRYSFGIKTTRSLIRPDAPGGLSREVLKVLESSFISEAK